MKGPISILQSQRREGWSGEGCIVWVCGHLLHYFPKMQKKMQKKTTFFGVGGDSWVGWLDRISKIK